jgi:type I restriction enzyme S subunit
VSKELYELPSGWIWTRVEEIAEVVRGASPRPKGDSRYFGGNIPWIMISDISKEKGKFVSRTRDTVTEEGAKKSRYLKAGTLILSNSGTVCVPKILAVDGCIHDGFVAFSRLKEGIGIFFLYYWLDYIRPVVIQENWRGITQVNLNTNIVKNLIVPLPPLAEQNRIVKKVEALFAESKTVREALENVPVLLRRFRQSVLTKAFIGQLTNREANDISAPELVSRIKSQEPKSDSSLRSGRRRTSLATRDSTKLAELPEGWDWVKFKDVAFAQNGRSFPSKFYTDDGVRLLRPGNLHASGCLSWTPENTRYLPQSFSDRYAEFLIRDNEIIMNLTAQSLKDEFLGRVCMTDQETYCLLNQRQARIRATEAIEGRYLFWVLKSPIFRNFVIGLESGTLIQHMFTWQLSDFLLPLAPLKEQKKVVQRIEECLSYADGAEKATKAALNRVMGMDQSILRKAFRGELVTQDPKR